MIGICWAFQVCNGKVQGLLIWIITKRSSQWSFGKGSTHQRKCLETHRIGELRLVFQSAFPVKNEEQEAEPDKEAKQRIRKSGQLMNQHVLKQSKKKTSILLQSWIFIGKTEAEAEAPILWWPGVKNWLIGKDPDAGKDWRQEKGRTEDEMVGWHHRLNGYEFEQAPGVGDGQGSLACYSP